MSIRSNKNPKDHLRGAATLTLVAQEPSVQDADSLRFWTNHPTKKTLVDLTVFRDGQQSTKAGNGGTLRKGPFKGRPELILEMAPVIRDHAAAFAEKSVSQMIATLRTWWRILDKLEAEMPGAAITSTTQLSELHRQRALLQNTARPQFTAFRQLASKTRVALGLKPLYWLPPEPPTRTRKLPPQWQTDLVRRELKHRWFAVLDRWSLAEELLAAGKPVACAESHPADFEEQKRLLQGYQHLEETIVATGSPRPFQLWKKVHTVRKYYELGYNHQEMLEGRYPSGPDVRAALLLCMATTGWNPAVLLGLNVQEPFIETHPKDPTRYILRGYKARAGGTEQISEGLIKTQGSAATVIKTLIERTAPLRAQLVAQAKELRQQHDAAAPADRDAIAAEIESIEEGIRSPWLYVSAVLTGIHWLTNSRNETAEFLSTFIREINLRQAPDRQIADLKPTDLRDAYAAHIYNSNGGSILAVMKALGHRRLSSTQFYLDNTLLKEQHRALYATFSTALWSEIQVHGRVDPTVLAKWSRDGIVTSDERERLKGYRNLMRSRLGIGCKDPAHPPRRISPEFEANGRALCHVQRCLLCTEHAVIFPESLTGICKRLAELRHLQSRMSVASFIQSSFAEELDNAEAALAAFPEPDVERHLGDWTERIARGAHRVVEFDGTTMKANT